MAVVDSATPEEPGVHAATPGRDPYFGIAVQDTACRYSVAGVLWYRDYIKKLAALGLLGEAREQEEKESYRFGNGGTLVSRVRATVPVVLGNTALLISFSVVDSPGLGLLLGRDFQTPAGVVLDMGKRTFKFGEAGATKSKMVLTRAGHFGMDGRWSERCWKVRCASPCSTSTV